MKRLVFIAVALYGLVSLYAQHQVNFLFDDKGLLRLETEELAEDRIVTVNHRSDDVVWSRVVYRIVDMRFKQNYQLYYPIVEDAEYSSLMKVMLDAIANDEMPLAVYSKSENLGDIRPYFRDENKIEGVAILDYLDSQEDKAEDEDVRVDGRILAEDSTGNLYFVQKNFEKFAKNQLKYLIQEVVFFDKHYSRLYSKILAIAPLRADHSIMTNDMPVMEALYGQLLFWIPFEALRPYMAQQYVMPKASDKTRVTFDEFFAKKLYTSYILGVSNMHNNRMIPDYATTNEEIKAEQDRIESELLNFEQDLWEY